MQKWTNYSEALAFVGNSLLAPMSQTRAIGLEPSFWKAFPSFDDVHVASALGACEAYAHNAQRRAYEGGDPIRDVSVEYTRLFVGSTRPAVPPWETMYRPGSEGAAVGFGQATFEMRGLLREAGLEVSNENNQYADHIGIELLFLSVLCGRTADGDDGAAGAARAFCDDRLLVWMGGLCDAANREAPGGYISGLLDLALQLVGALASTC